MALPNQGKEICNHDIAEEKLIHSYSKKEFGAYKRINTKATSQTDHGGHVISFIGWF